MKKINLALLTLATLMGVSSTAVVFADDATSTGTLEITDGDVTLNSIDSLDFGSFQYNNSDISVLLKDSTNTTGKEAVHVTDTRANPTGWTVSGSTQDTGANLTINGVTLTSLSGAGFTKAADNENFGQQSLNIDKDSTNIALTKDQAKATAGKSITLNVDWTISKTVPKASDFN
ncbi:WxL domain-containing protein [Lactococcus cremoris]|uniref:Putative secreted protein n=1 Tax=Lactococcus cremoris subsp. cremoris GE214 TaxID=1415168 RepID=A0A084A9B0_LACLC|nr:WxL domain-containing protein [Lactococcus cremoris]KEY61889.1 putative secreted protein [Lactococcus cremoris subsp. cremoris GE214]